MKIADSYINLLSSFSDEIKLRVIRKLSESLLRGKERDIHTRFVWRLG